MLLRQLCEQAGKTLSDMTEAELLEFIENTRSDRASVLEGAFGERQSRRTKTSKKKVFDPVAERERQEKMEKMAELMSADDEF